MNGDFKKVRKMDLDLLDNFLVEKTDYSNVKPLNLKFDVIFMSYYEKNADENFETLKKLVPNAKRVNGVKGILNAYNACRELSETTFYYIVEGDSIVCNDFDFKLPIQWCKNIMYFINKKADIINVSWKNTLMPGFGKYATVNVTPREESVDFAKVCTDLSVCWDTINPVNGEIAPHSPIGLTFKSNKPYEYYEKNTENGQFRTEADTFKTTGIFTRRIGSIDAFNSSPYDAWKAGFRIGNKLAYRILNIKKTNHNAIYQEERLHHWESVGYDRHNGKYCIEGVKLGKSLALKDDNWWLKYRETSQDFNNLKNIFIKEYGTEYYNN